MPDIVSKEIRSRIMAAIGPMDTRPERAVRRYLHGAGLRFRLHAGGLPGRPDIVLPAYRAVVFVHGCFWHRHDGCPRTTTPSTRPAFWMAKFTGNVNRDRRQREALEAAAWRVFVVWECTAEDELALDFLVWSLRALAA